MRSAPNAADEDRRFMDTLILINMLIGNSRQTMGGVQVTFCCGLSFVLYRARDRRK